MLHSKVNAFAKMLFNVTLTTANVFSTKQSPLVLLFNKVNSPPTCMDPSLSYFRHNLTCLNASCFFIHPERCLIVDLMGSKHWKCFQLEVDKTASEFRVEIWAAVHCYKYWVFISFWSCKHALSGPFFFLELIFFFWDGFFVSPFSCHFERNNLELPTVIMLFCVTIDMRRSYQWKLWLRVSCLISLF